jgi:hypothetical protein
MIFHLFNDAFFNFIVYISSNGRMITDEMKMVWKNTIVDSFKVLSRNLQGRLRNETKEHQDSRPPC